MPGGSVRDLAWALQRKCGDLMLGDRGFILGAGGL